MIEGWKITSELTMQANNREAQRHKIEDKIIAKVDRSRPVKCQRPRDILLRVPIIELITYRAAVNGKAIQAGCSDAR